MNISSMIFRETSRGLFQCPRHTPCFFITRTCNRGDAYCASILDFKARLGNRCKVLPVYAILCASILDFKARLENRCSVLAAAVRNGPPAVVVVATRSASDSILRCREEERFRLQDAVADAGGDWMPRRRHNPK